MKALISIALAAAGLAAAVPAQASEYSNSVLVSYGDLNLASARGQQTFERRVRSAARQVCGPQGDLSLVAIISTKQCVAAALEGARPLMQVAMRGKASGARTLALAASR